MEASNKHLFLVSLILTFLFQTVSADIAAEPAEPPQPAAGKHFVLVHGACLGAWSWFKLVPLLRAYGHTVTAFDLAASGIDSRQVTDIPSIADYFQPLTDFMAALPSQERVVLVGHSFGGLAISQSMELFPEKISVAVFVTASMPGPNYNISALDQDVCVMALFNLRFFFFLIN